LAFIPHITKSRLISNANDKKKTEELQKED